MTTAVDGPKQIETREAMKYILPICTLAFALGYSFWFLTRFIRQIRIDALGVDVCYLFSTRRLAWQQLSWATVGRQSSQLHLIIRPRKGSNLTLSLGDESVQFLNTIHMLAAAQGVNLINQL